MALIGGANGWLASAAGVAIVCLGMARADGPRAARRADLGRFPAKAVENYETILPRPEELRWQQIPWLTDLTEAVRLARDERRPLFLWVSGDEPLERC